MENGETVIGMLRHVTIRLQYQSHKCTSSWASNNEEEYTEVTEHYRRKHPLLALGGVSLGKTHF